MKIDEKVVSYFEACKSPVDKEGYLSKKGEIKTSYQKRWFVLKGNLLFYKERPADRDLIGVIVLEGCTVQLCESEEQFAFSLVWSEPGLRTYKFAAEDQVSQESWIKALLSANHSYLALLVMDMEKKYRDTLNAHSGNPSKHFNTPQSSGPAAQSSYASQVLGAGAPLSSNQQLHDLTRTASKQSSVLRSKQNPNMVRGGTSGLEQSDFYLGDEDNFGQMHEEFGKEVKKMIADWSKKKHRGQVFREENLIDFE